jgi:hypothetical protein
LEVYGTKMRCTKKTASDALASEAVFAFTLQRHRRM